jgi:hypothetical protein
VACGDRSAVAPEFLNMRLNGERVAWSLSGQRWV